MDKHGPLFNTMHNFDSQRSSVGFLTILLEKVGAVNFYCKDKKWKNHLQDFYCYFQYTAIITYITFHLLSTIVRSIHYVPHFIEFFAEDIYFVSLMMQTLLLKSKYKQLAELAILMEDSFQQRGNRIAQKFQQRAKNILRIVFSLLACLEISFVLEVLFPRDKEDRELWGKVYKTKHPERKLPVNIWIPTIDESEPGIYQWIFIYQVYVLSVVIVFICVSFTLMPILILYLKGQHVILCEYIEKIGARHYDVEGQEIHFTNIETNEYTRILNNRRDGYNSLYKRDRVENMTKNKNRIILYDTWVRDEAGRSDDEFVRSHRIKHRARRPPQNSRFDPNNTDHLMETPVGGPIPNSAQSMQDESYSQEMYQRRYLRQIIRFHQKLLIFQDKMRDVFNANLAIQTSSISVNIALCLYQLVNNIESLSHLCTSVGKLFSCLLQSYYFCVCSDVLNECNVMIRRAIRNSAWTDCASSTRRDLHILLMRTQRSNYLSFCRGTFILRPRCLLKVIKFAYSFVNCIRARTGGHTDV